MNVDDNLAVLMMLPYGKPCDLLEEDGRRFYEVLRPGAFDRTLATPTEEVVADYCHRKGLTLGRRSDGSLDLWHSPQGLMAQLTVNRADSLAMAFVVAVADRTATGASFTFVPRGGGERWTRLPSGRFLHELLSARLVAVTIAERPAYRESTVELVQARWLLERLERERRQRLERLVRQHGLGVLSGPNLRRLRLDYLEWRYGLAA